MQANDGAIVVDSLERLFKLRKRKKRHEGPRIIKALDGVDISVKQGELFGLLGPNGAGKTTLIKILCTLLLPTTGRAFVNGYDVVKESSSVREIISMVSGGESCGYGILTPRENLWLFSQFYGLTFKEAKENIDKMLDVVGLTEYKHTKMYELSTGMRQKINFSRGFVTNPRIVFLDEPTLGMDVNAARDIRAFLKDWMAENRDRTIILTTHYMAEAEELCDRVAIIDRGKIRLSGTMSEIREHMRSGRFKRDATAQADGATAKRVTITFSKPATDAEKLILEQPGVQEVKIIGTEAVVEHVGTQESLANLLKVLVVAEWPVVGFKSEQEGLEDVFMAVTEGGLE